MKITLGERTAETAAIYFERARSPAIREMLPQKAQTLEEALEDFRKTQEPGANSFGRTIYAGGQYVGDVWCYCMDSGGDPQAMVSYCVFEPALWGRGAASEALRLFLEEIRERFGLERIGAFTFAANTGSIRVLEKNGFRLAESFTENGVESGYYLHHASMRILYAGFKGKNNSSYQLVSHLPGERCFLTNSLGGLRRDIDGIRRPYDAVCLFGLDKNLRGSVRIETCAENAGRMLYTTANLSELAERFSLLGIPYSISQQPTQYLCNAAYCALLEKMSCPVLLVHIPSLRNLPEGMFAQLQSAFTFETFL